MESECCFCWGWKRHQHKTVGEGGKNDGGERMEVVNCVVKIVMEWIWSQICPSENPDRDEEKKSSPQEKTWITHSN